MALARVPIVAALAWLALGPHPTRPPPSTEPLPAPPRPLAAPPHAPVQRQRGVALGMFAEDVSFSYAPLLAEIVAVGANAVALVIPYYLTDGGADDLALHTRFSPTLGLVADTVRVARRDDLDVMLFPIIRLASPKPGEWRGTLAPRDRERWFRHYGDALGELAAVAAVTGAKSIVVGSELSTLDTAADIDRWRPLIDRVRAIFGGKLVYSANWDHYRDAALYDLVDEEGISGYFNIRDPNAPADDATLEDGWRRVRRELDAWHANRPRPLLFTELGYRSRTGATASPWDETPGGTPNLDEQRRAFAAFRRVWTGASSLDGAYIWNWYGYGGPTSVGYTPRGKPAEVEVRALLNGL
jgi:hypothetical protein